jgi:tRNA (guanine-N7-)-methyltransferase
MNDESRTFLRRVRSFVRREGRMTASQKRALEVFWSEYGIENEASVIDFQALYQRDADTVLEIGFGMGTSLADMAEAQPEVNFLGIEVHRPGVGHLLNLVAERHLTNVRVICDDAVEVLQKRIPADSLSGVNLFFPDPWPKKKHHKRRIVQPDFIDMIRRSLKMGGTLHMATDWQAYAEHMLDVMQQATGFENLSGSNDYVDRPATRPLTKFEQRGERLGHAVRDLQFRRIA